MELRVQKNGHRGDIKWINAKVAQTGGVYFEKKDYNYYFSMYIYRCYIYYHKKYI